jgi:hypothetical protein
MAIWIDLNNNLHDDMNGEALSLPNWPEHMQLATQAQIDAITNPAPTAQQLHANLVASAKTALDASDVVAIRCFKAGVQFPGAWVAYVVALRNIINGTDTTSTALPTVPAYPAGS